MSQNKKRKTSPAQPSDGAEPELPVLELTAEDFLDESTLKMIEFGKTIKFTNPKFDMKQLKLAFKDVEGQHVIFTMDALFVNTEKKELKFEVVFRHSSDGGWHRPGHKIFIFYPGLQADCGISELSIALFWKSVPVHTERVKEIIHTYAMKLAPFLLGSDYKKARRLLQLFHPEERKRHNSDWDWDDGFGED